MASTSDKYFCANCRCPLTKTDEDNALALLETLSIIAGTDLDAAAAADAAIAAETSACKLSIPIVVDRSVLSPPLRSALSEAATNLDGLDFYESTAPDDNTPTAHIYQLDQKLTAHLDHHPADRKALEGLLGGPVLGTSHAHAAKTETEETDHASMEANEEAGAPASSAKKPLDFSSTSELGFPLCHVCFAYSVAELGLGAAGACAGQVQLAASLATTTAPTTTAASRYGALRRACASAGMEAPPVPDILADSQLTAYDDLFTDAPAPAAANDDAPVAGVAAARHALQLAMDADKNGSAEAAAEAAAALSDAVAALREQRDALTAAAAKTAAALAVAAEREHQLAREERGLAALERGVWSQLSFTDAQSVDAALTKAHAHATAAAVGSHLALLSTANVLEDAFPLDITGGVPVINGNRVGWLPQTGAAGPAVTTTGAAATGVNWAEISSGLGDLLLLVRTLIRITRCPIVGWDLRPAAGRSAVVATTTHESGVLAIDPSVFTAISPRPAQHFAIAITGLIDCLAQVVAHLGPENLRYRVTFAIHLRGAAASACDGIALERAERLRRETVSGKSEAGAPSLLRPKARPVAFVNGQSVQISSVAPEALVEWTAALRGLWPLLREIVGLVGRR